jgi:regulatory protein
MAKTALRQLTYEQALTRVTSLCSASEYCIHDINEKLYRWGICNTDSERIIDYLLDEKYIDEARYAQAYTNDKLRFSHWGRIKIKSMLRMKHISDRDINNALDNISEEEYESILRDIIKGKAKSEGDAEDYASRAKIIRFALQRGFEMGEITKFISEY